MKKLFKALVLVLVAFLVVACGTTNNTGNNNDNNNDNNDATGNAGETYEIGVAIYQYTDNFMTLYREELATYFEELGTEDGNTYNLDFQDGKNDQATQTEQINNFITQGKDVIIANLVEPTGANTIIESAKAADIPIVLINREPDNEALKVWPGKVTYVGVDARQSGTYQGEIIADLPDKGDLNGDGKVSYIMIMGDTANVDAQQRTEFSIKRLSEDIEVELLGEELRGNWDQTLGQELAANALSQFGDQIEVIFSNNDGMALGAKTAIDAAGRTVNEDIYLVGVDGLPEVVEMLDNGEFTGTVLNDHINQSHTAADVALKLLAGEDVAEYYWHDYLKVLQSSDAVADIVAPREETR